MEFRFWDRILLDCTASYSRGHDRMTVGFTPTLLLLKFELDSCMWQGVTYNRYVFYTRYHRPITVPPFTSCFCLSRK